MSMRKKTTIGITMLFILLFVIKNYLLLILMIISADSPTDNNP